MLYFDETAGQIGCIFFRDGEEICTLRSSADSNPEIDRVELTCNGNLFYSEFDTESTLFPGIFRSVQNKEDGKEIFRLILADDCLYEDGFRYTIDIKGSMQIKVREEQDSVSFWNEDEIIAYTVIEENWNQDYPQMAGIDISRQIVTYFEKEINETVTMAILAVPALDYEA